VTSLFEAFPALERKIPWVRLGEWPTPIEPLRVAGREIWVKRDDLTGRVYGGNKVRTLEAMFGRAQAEGASRIWATGAYGSNHALATVLHAPAAGLEPGVMLFPQPPSATAADNLRAVLGTRPRFQRLLSWATLPLAVVRRRRERSTLVMLPGAAVPEGALGYVAAGLELAGQIAGGAAPLPSRIFVGVGSTCTSAGLLVGLWIAERKGLLARRPIVCAVRVTPWPVTSVHRIVSLAMRTARLLASLTAIPEPAGRELARGLRVIGGFIGRGYGHTTASGIAAQHAFAAAGGPPLDTVYAAKSAAGALAAAPNDAPTLYWSTKSSRPLPPVDSAACASSPKALIDWLGRCDRTISR
jgi:1-aminocyclopropane-1-carboxylate deaminase/D-cysteine desulfhydrase-like pyridoxal-dependent ACC family enzyme